MHVLRIAIAVLCLVEGGVLTDAALAATAKKPAAAAKTAKRGAATPSTAQPAAKKKRARTVSRSRRRGSRRGRISSVPRQAQPSKERYAEIQQALLDKGYFSGEATGEWKADSVEALKRFQSDEALQPSGKINSLSLIALGLGPKRNPMTIVPVTTQPPAEEPSSDAEPLQLPPAPVIEQQ